MSQLIGIGLRRNQQQKLIKLKNFRSQIKAGIDSLSHQLSSSTSRQKSPTTIDITLKDRFKLLNLKGKSIPRLGANFL